MAVAKGTKDVLFNVDINEGKCEVAQIIIFRRYNLIYLVSKLKSLLSPAFVKLMQIAIGYTSVTHHCGSINRFEA